MYFHCEEEDAAADQVNVVPVWLYRPTTIEPAVLDALTPTGNTPPMVVFVDDATRTEQILSAVTPVSPDVSAPVVAL